MKSIIDFFGHPLRFDFNATCLIEQVCGEDIFTRMETGTLVPSMSIVRGLLWGGLHRADPTKTLEDAGNILGQLLEDHSITDLSEKLFESLDSAFPDEVAKGDEAGNAPAG